MKEKYRERKKEN
jgi:hypothetical protein